MPDCDRCSNPALFYLTDMQVGDQVFVVSALDPDTAPPVTYAFTDDGNPDETFSLDYITGRVTLAKSLDHELVQAYRIGLQVSDTVHIVNSNLHVNVTDENDNAPVFRHNNYEVRIRNHRSRPYM